MRELTAKQRDVLAMIVEEWEDTRIAPTRAEIAAEFGYNNQTAVDDVLKALEKKRYIRIIPGKWRGIEVLRNYQ